ncbi:MAG: hypothetical protein IPJ06_00385 [Saprospiraceae bacterium]|nr:hypothetical protein [Saprospiraceae bacterium]
MVTNTLKHTRANIVILAFTNRAVNEICNKLRSRDIPFLYLGHRGSDEDVSIQGLAEEATIDEMRHAIAGYRVMVSTSAGFAMKMKDLSAITRFDVLMVDESSQLTEPGLAGILLDSKVHPDRRPEPAPCRGSPAGRALYHHGRAFGRGGLSYVE